MLLAQGVAAASAVVLAACGGSTTPSGAGAAGTSPSPGMFEDTEFDLIIDPNRAPLVSGLVGGKVATATGSLTSGGATTITGVLAGLDLIAHLRQQDQVRVAGGYRTTTQVAGSVGPSTTSLDGTFTLDSGYLFQKGDITGSNQGHQVQVLALPLTGPDVRQGAALGGSFGSTPIALSAVISVGATGSVTGTVDGRTIRFDVAKGPTSPHGNVPTLRVTGNYSGPADLFALIVGGIAYFGA